MAKAKPVKLTAAQLAQIQERTRRLHNQEMDRLVRAEPVRTPAKARLRRVK
jgi:hypothetical protein